MLRRRSLAPSPPEPGPSTVFAHAHAHSNAHSNAHAHRKAIPPRWFCFRSPLTHSLPLKQTDRDTHIYIYMYILPPPDALAPCHATPHHAPDTSARSSLSSSSRLPERSPFSRFNLVLPRPFHPIPAPSRIRISMPISMHACHMETSWFPSRVVCSPVCAHPSPRCVRPRSLGWGLSIIIIIIISIIIAMTSLHVFPPPPSRTSITSQRHKRSKMRCAFINQFATCHAAKIRAAPALVSQSRAENLCTPTPTPTPGCPPSTQAMQKPTRPRYGLVWYGMVSPALNLPPRQTPSVVRLY